jgi:hypothetical protein
MQTSTPSFPRLNVRSTTIFHYYLNEPSEYETSLEVIYRWNGRSGWIDTGSFWRKYDHLARRRVWGLNSADMFPNRYSDSLTRLFQNRISGRFARCCIIIRKRHVIDKEPSNLYNYIFENLPDVFFRLRIPQFFGWHVMEARRSPTAARSLHDYLMSIKLFPLVISLWNQLLEWLEGFPTSTDASFVNHICDSTLIAREFDWVGRKFDITWKEKWLIIIKKQ